MMSQRDEVVARDPSKRLYCLLNPVCLERPEEAREEAPSFHLLARLVRKMGRALIRMLG
jgi:hypothetical protein